MKQNICLVLVLLMMITLLATFGFTPSQARQISSTSGEDDTRLAAKRTMRNGCVELLSNGNFESGEISPWVESSNHAKTLLSTVRPRESSHSALLGDANRADDQLYQEIILPFDATSLTLSYWYTIQATDSPGQDVMSVALRSGIGERLRTLTSIEARTILDWQQGTHDLMDYRGQTLQLHFRGVTDSNNQSNFSLDDISLQACGVTLPTATPTTSVEHKLFLPLVGIGE